jgi:hypothetical protein
MKYKDRKIIKTGIVTDKRNPLYAYNGESSPIFETSSPSIKKNSTLKMSSSLICISKAVLFVYPIFKYFFTRIGNASSPEFAGSN